MFAGLQRPRGHRNGRAPARIESLAAAAGLAPAAIKELVEPAPVARPLTLLVSTPCTEPWNVRRALHGKEPISGTHTALLAVARAFARHGWQVTVAGNVDPPTGDAIITDWVGDTITSFPRGWRAAANITYLPSCLQSASKRSRAPLPFAPGPHRIALAEANWEQSNATRCCTDRDPEPRRVGRCRYRAEQTRCATAAGASCPVACQQCVLCPTHPMMPVYATAYPYADLGSEPRAAWIDAPTSAPHTFGTRVGTGCRCRASPLRSCQTTVAMASTIAVGSRSGRGSSRWSSSVRT